MMSHPRRWMTPLVLLALLASLVLSGGCGKNLMEADNVPPVGSMITNPPDGAALNSPVIDVRGRAEVGATIRILVNGELKGTAVSYPAAQSEGGLGRFTVESVDLGEEGHKEIVGVVTDLYGNRAEKDLLAEIDLDMHAPPVSFEAFVGAEPDTLDGHDGWRTGLPAVTLIGLTDTTASQTRVRFGINEFTPDSSLVFPGDPGEPDAMRFWVPMTSPPLTILNPDSTVVYYVEALDPAGNSSAEAVKLSWIAAGKETVLSWDDSDYGNVQNRVSGQAGMAFAVLFDNTPAWANFVTGMQVYIMNDDITNPDNPTAPTTKPFTAYVWKTDGDYPLEHANDGYQPFGMNTCPEDSLVTFYFGNAINITNNDDFPDKKFCVGFEYLYKNNPVLGVDTDEPSGRSFHWNWTDWERAEGHDYIIHAIVSDLQSHGGDARTAVLTPRIVRVPMPERQ